jgi:hypothetical protein
MALFKFFLELLIRAAAAFLAPALLVFAAIFGGIAEYEDITSAFLSVWIILASLAICGVIYVVR